jgi:hypothetical protein
MDPGQIYLAAATSFMELVERIPADRWDGPGLGVWNLRELTGHTVSAGFRTVLVSLAQPAQRRDTSSAARYYALARTVDPAFYQATVAASEEDARGEATRLGEHPAAVLRPLLSEVAAAVEAVECDQLIETPAGGMAVADWLATRSFELAVHGLDVAAATGVPVSLSDEVLAEAGALAVRIGAEVGDGAMVLLALTGRGALPAGYCVL